MATFSHGLPGSSTGRRGCSLCVGRLRRQVSQRPINLFRSRLIPGHQMALAARSRQVFVVLLQILQRFHLLAAVSFEIHSVRESHFFAE